jgi:two-component SAPR family response regulator
MPIKQRFPSLPIILLSAYSEMPERILWLADDYVMKSEMPERLIPIIERGHGLSPHSDEPQPSKQQRAESVFGSTVLDVIQLSRRAMLKIWII